MTLADWLIVVVVVVSTLISLKRGFVREALSLLSWVAAVLVALLFHARLGLLLEPYIEMSGLRLIAAFALLFIGTLIVGAAVNFLIGELVDLTGLTGTDRALGTVFGLVRGGILVLLVLMAMQPLLKPEQYAWWRDSHLIPHFLLMEHWARETGQELSLLFHRIVEQP